MQHENIAGTIAWQKNGPKRGSSWNGSRDLRAFMRDWYMVKAAKPPLSGCDFMTVFVMLYRALQYVHGKGFLHLDVKPENFLASGLRPIAEVSTARSKDTQIFKKEILQQAGRSWWKLVDFGVAHSHGRAGGSPLYVAPEVVGNGTQSQVGPASDIWSLGATMYEIGAAARRSFRRVDHKNPALAGALGEDDRQDAAVKKAYDMELLKTPWTWRAERAATRSRGS